MLRVDRIRKQDTPTRYLAIGIRKGNLQTTHGVNDSEHGLNSVRENHWLEAKTFFRRIAILVEDNSKHETRRSSLSRSTISLYLLHLFDDGAFARFSRS